LRAITPMSVDDISVLDDRELNIRFRDVSRAIRKVKGQTGPALRLNTVTYTGSVRFVKIVQRCTMNTRSNSVPAIRKIVRTTTQSRSRF
jgi:hypothetical protein